MQKRRQHHSTFYDKALELKALLGVGVVISPVSIGLGSSGNIAASPCAASPSSAGGTSFFQSDFGRRSVSALKSDKHRGIVKSTAGAFQTGSSINATGCNRTLRGSGDDSNGNAILSVADTRLENLSSDGNSSAAVNNATSMGHPDVDNYGPADSIGFALGVSIRIIIPNPQNWICDTEVDLNPPKTIGGMLRPPHCNRCNGGAQRVTTGIAGSGLFFDAPEINVLNSQNNKNQIVQRRQNLFRPSLVRGIGFNNVPRNLALKRHDLN